MSVIPIRAHHIEAVKSLYTKPPEGAIKSLILFDYIKSEKDRFINFMQEFKKFFDHPGQEFKIKIGGLDLICCECPRLKNEKCNPINPKNRETDLVAWRYESKLADLQIAQKYDLTPGGIYTVKQLRVIAKF